MIRVLSISMVALSLSACATTKKLDASSLEKVEVRATELVEGDIIDSKETFKHAQALYASGHFKDALAAYENTIMTAGPEFVFGHEALLGVADSALALAAYSQDYQVKAAKAYMALLDAPNLPVDYQDRILAGQVLLEIAVGKSDDVEVRLNEALETNLYDPRLWNALGRFHDQSGEWVLATETYVKAMEAAGEAGYPLAPIINNMGMSSLIQGRSRDALKKFEQALEMNPDSHIYDNNRRLALILTGRMDRAIDGLTDKRAAQIYNDAGFITAGRGRVRQARSYYTKAIELSPIYFEKAEFNLLALAELETEQPS